MSFSIAGKTAIVTGAANGVGLAIARHFADQGANVMCADRDEDGLIEGLGAVADEDGEGPGNIRYFAGDLRERLTQANLLSATLDAFDQVDILVNASRQVLETDPLDIDDQSVEQSLEQNLMTALRLSQLVACRMISQGEGLGEEAADQPLGSIINLSSIAARRTRPELLGFSLASAALEQMTRSLAVALAPERIRVNAVAFGSVMSASLMDSIRDRGELRDKVIDATPLGRIANPAELAETVRYLASDGSSFVTGQVIDVDGGRSLTDAVCDPAH